MGARALCSICRDELVSIDNGNDVVSLSCGHVGHRHCFMKWFTTEFEMKVGRKPEENESVTGSCHMCGKESPLEEMKKLFISVEDDNMDDLNNKLTDLSIELDDVKITLAFANGLGQTALNRFCIANAENEKLLQELVSTKKKLAENETELLKMGRDLMKARSDIRKNQRESWKSNRDYLKALRQKEMELKEMDSKLNGTQNN